MNNPLKTSTTELYDFMIPNQEVLQKLVASFPEEVVKDIIATRKNAIDVCFGLIPLVVDLTGVKVGQAYDMFFGNGSYAKFQQFLINELTNND